MIMLRCLTWTTAFKVLADEPVFVSLLLKREKKKIVDNYKLLSHIKNKLLSYLKMIHHFLHKRIAKMGIFFFASVSCPKTSF